MSKSPRFEVGAKVHFVNDYGIPFPDKTITEITDRMGVCYYYEPSESPWFASRESHFAADEQEMIEMIMKRANVKKSVANKWIQERREQDKYNIVIRVVNDTISNASYRAGLKKEWENLVNLRNGWEQKKVTDQELLSAVEKLNDQIKNG